MRIPPLLLTSMVLACSATSVPPTVEGPCERWGSVREVMGRQQTQGRVGVLAAVDADERAVGLGVLAGLRGEVIVVDGRAWVSHAAGSQLPPSPAATPDDEAAFLVLSRVPRWEELVIPRAVRADELPDLLRQEAVALGLGQDGPFPFVITGTLESVSVHVPNGKCPRRHPGLTGEEAPFRATLAGETGTLVGFYGTALGGTLAHHGSPIHVHARTDGIDSGGIETGGLVGHADDFVLATGARLRLPALAQGDLP